MHHEETDHAFFCPVPDAGHDLEAKSIVENSPHRTDIFNALRLLAGMMRKAVSR